MEAEQSILRYICIISEYRIFKTLLQIWPDLMLAFLTIHHIYVNPAVMCMCVCVCVSCTCYILSIKILVTVLAK